MPAYCSQALREAIYIYIYIYEAGTFLLRATVLKNFENFNGLSIFKLFTPSVAKVPLAPEVTSTSSPVVCATTDALYVKKGNNIGVDGILLTTSAACSRSVAIYSPTVAG